MRCLSLAGKLALVAAALLTLGGCCDQQERTIATLRMENGALGKRLIDEETTTVQLNERILSHQNDARKLNDLIASRDQTVQATRDQVDILQKALDKRNAEYEMLLGKLGEMGTSRPAGGIPPPVGQLLRALAATYPGLFTFDQASGRLRFASDVTFALGKADISPKAAEALGKLAAILMQDEAKPLRIEVVGHTCTTPIAKAETKRIYPTNQVLSKARAEAVAKVLTTAGVEGTRIITRGMGSTQLLVPATPRAAQNRRVEIFLSMP